MENVTESRLFPWKMLVFLFFIQLVIAFVARSLAPLGAVIGQDLNLTMFQIGLFPAALFLGQSLVSIPSGILTDKIGSRNMLVIISLLLSITFYLIALSSSFLMIFILIIFAGFAYGSSHPSTNKGVNSWFDLKKRGTAMGIKQMGVTMGSASAALLLLPLATSIGWPGALSVAASILLIFGIIFYFKYQEPEKLNTIKKTEIESNPLNIFLHRKLILITISAMLLSGSQAVLNTFIVLYAFESLSLSLILAGILLGIAEFGGAVGRLGWGWLSDNLFSGRRLIVLLIISVLVAVQSIITSLMPVGTPFYLTCIIIFIFGLGASGFNGIWMNATSEIVPSSLSGTATGVSITFSSWGAILFPPLFGIIRDYTGSYFWGWWLIVLLMIISTLALLIAVKSKNKY
ncbi:MFS transporter [Salinicoccus halitifaciens]|uniref:Sugar phosphate permease n=1 Tax=Salinicoccus halitifaciens TaxID=1073415 RepID=A0ABV2E7Y3_9STAP|nr:MFS transporter [Salinicoccus halitifaciens]MCD2136410.1 MFS transporter [Salinicoccus halitifaciens]